MGSTTDYNVTRYRLSLEVYDLMLFLFKKEKKIAIIDIIKLGLEYVDTIEWGQIFPASVDVGEEGERYNMTYK